MLAKNQHFDNTKEKDFFKEYLEIFSILKINHEKLNHEWKKEGDSIKEFDLFEDHPKPIITTYTHSIH